MLAVGSPTQEPTAEGKPASYWIDMLRAGDMGVRLHASTMLSGMGEKAVPYLVSALKEDRSDARGNLLTTLGMMGPAAEGAVPVISELLYDDSLSIRVTAAATLVNIDCEHRVEAWPTLVAALDGDDFSVTLAATTIGSLGADGAPAVPALARHVHSTDREVQLRAMGALGSIGPPAHSALPALEKAAKEEGIVRGGAEAAIERIKGKGFAVPTCSERRRQQQPR
jgi:HEAT repeat protein